MDLNMAANQAKMKVEPKVARFEGNYLALLYFEVQTVNNPFSTIECQLMRRARLFACGLHVVDGESSTIIEALDRAKHSISKPEERTACLRRSLTVQLIVSRIEEHCRTHEC
jgi:hypothetical protein